MPKFVVFFDQLVIYLPDHKLSRRMVSHLVVNSTGAEEAMIHGLRTTRGPGKVVRTVLASDLSEEERAVLAQPPARSRPDTSRDSGTEIRRA